MSERRCPRCGTPLSRYNDGDYCALHEREEPVVGLPLQRRNPIRRARRSPLRRGNAQTRELWHAALAQLDEARDFATTIASAWGYTYAELTAPGRRDELVTLRARLAHHFREQGFALEAIGELLGRHHATVLNMLRMDVPR